MTVSIFDLTDRVLDTLVHGLEQKHSGGIGVAETLTRLRAQDRTNRQEPTVTAQDDPACRYLPAGLTAARQIDEALGAAIGDLVPLLHWERISQHVSRPKGTFMDDYAMANLIGPNGVYPGEDFMIGLFIIGPGQVYPDHSHAAPELYWLFSGPTAWRFSVGGQWVELGAGELQFNKSFGSHAIRTGDVPFFAIWAWNKDIDGDYSLAGAEGATSFNRPRASYTKHQR